MNKLHTSDQIYEFLKVINDFKSIKRLSVIKSGGRRESDAEHTWHLVMFVWMYSYLYEKKYDLLKSIKIALVHDLVEIYSGDVYGVGAVDKNQKENRERISANKLFSLLPTSISEELITLWEEYEERVSEESRFVWALDKIAPRFQLSLTGKDEADKLPIDIDKKNLQEKTISQISPVLGDLLLRTSKKD